MVDNEQSKIPEEGNIDSQVKSIKQSLSNTHGISDELSYQEVKEILYTCKGQFDLTIGQCHDARKAKVGCFQMIHLMPLSIPNMNIIYLQ